MSRDETTLLDIANAARLIQTFMQGMTREAFLGDLKTQSGGAPPSHCARRGGQAAFPGISRAASDSPMVIDGRDAGSSHTWVRCG
jgi:hypothetical protein